MSDIGDKGAGSLPALLQPSALTARSQASLIVHGQAQGGRLFTLYDGFVRSSNVGMGSLSTATLYFNRGFEGACVDDPVTLPVERIYMRYPGMDAWLGAHPFEVEYEQGMKRVSISHTIPERESFRIDDPRQLILLWSREGPSQSVVQTRIGIKALPWLGIEYSAPVPQDRACEDASVVGELLSMFLGAPTASRQISMMSSQCTFEVGGKMHQKELETFGAYSKLPQSFRDWMHIDPLLPLSAVRSDLGALLQRWFQLRHACWGVIVPYLAGQRSPAPFAERRFFDFAAAAESLYTHLRPEEKNFPNSEARKIWKNVRTSVPKERRKSFCIALQRVNALTYKERLERLLQRFPALVNDVVGDFNEQATFCKLVKDLRNAEAHRLTRTDARNIGGSRLVRIAAKLKVIIDAWILAEIGIADSVIEEAMRKNRKYWFYASSASWPWNIAADE